MSVLNQVLWLFASAFTGLLFSFFWDLINGSNVLYDANKWYFMMIGFPVVWGVMKLFEEKSKKPLTRGRKAAFLAIVAITTLCLSVAIGYLIEG